MLMIEADTVLIFPPALIVQPRAPKRNEDLKKPFLARSYILV
jgi:hypothetical protein